MALGTHQQSSLSTVDQWCSANQARSKKTHEKQRSAAVCTLAMVLNWFCCLLFLELAFLLCHRHHQRRLKMLVHLFFSYFPLSIIAFSDFFWLSINGISFSLPASTFVLLNCLLETQRVYVQLNKTDKAEVFCSNALGEYGEAVTLQGPQWLVIQPPTFPHG